MKGIVFLSGLVFLMAVFFSSAWTATESVWEKEGNKLVQYKLIRIGEYPAPPKEVTPEVAGEIIEGKREKYRTKTAGEEIVAKLFPVPEREKEITTTIISFSGKKWIKQVFLSGVERRKDWFDFVCGIILPGIGIFIISLFSQKNRAGNRKLLLFYGAMVISFIAGEFLGGLAGIIIGAFAGGFAGGIAENRSFGAYGNAGLLFGGMFVGMFVGMFASLLAVNGFAEAVLQYYFLYIVLVCFFSFVLAKTMFIRKTKTS